MRRTILTAHHVEYALDVATDADALRGRVVDALRAGGDFVTFTTATAEEIGILVSAGSAITFRTAAVADVDETEVPGSGAVGKLSPFIDDLDWLEHSH